MVIIPSRYRLESVFLLVRAGLIIRDDDQVVRSVWIDLDGLELACRNLVLEQDIEFGVCKTLKASLVKGV